ncbi:MAG: ribonuclease Z [Paramuribaculum sp.]|nr:ribonuclease Z [Paramuribaculum sp.]MDE6322872.1 ribonuclease Z [Paramuribaculum sp.]MDE6487989.1 ribonuclease Z [Paramuribaculum sp.]
MSDFQVNILGCGSATPSPLRNTSAQVIDYRRRLMMIDCGEGAQSAMRRMGLQFSRLTHIFISHMHGDHCLGLPGLLSTLALHGKEGTITVVLPESGLRIMKEITDYFCREPQLEIIFQPVGGNGGIVADLPSMSVEAFPLYHRIETYGYIFREKPKQRHLKGDMVNFYNVPVAMRPLLKEGADFVTEDGRTIENRLLTTDPDPSRSYAYCSDTMFDERVAKAVNGVDLLYHEATYGHSLVSNAHERGHSTALEAARIASLANAGNLMIGHYSKRYTDVTPLVREAQTVFPKVIAAHDGLKIDLEKL